MSALLSNVVIPVAGPDDASATGAAAVPRIAEANGSITAVYVVEKSGGGPDKAPVGAREATAERAFEELERQCRSAGVPFDQHLVYDRDVTDGVFAVADAVEASAIVFTPREGGRFIRLVTGDNALALITETDRPVVVLSDG